MPLVDELRGRNNQQDRRFYGVVTAVVTNIDDPDGLGRVKVQFPWLSEDQESFWARISNLLAGNGFGSWYRPAVGTEVLVAFEHGDIRFPYVLGMLWNGSDKPPQPASADVAEHDKVIKTARESVLVFGESPDDESKQYIQLRVRGSQGAVLEMKADGTVIIDATKITISGSQEITLDAPTINLKGDSVNIDGSTTVKMKGAQVEVQASGQLTLKGAVVNIN